MKEYTISEIVPESILSESFFIRRFESMEDAELEWPHSHLFLSFLWFTSGSGIYVIDSEEYEIKPQRVFCIASKQIHNWGFYDNTKGYFIAIDPLSGVDMNLSYAQPYIDVDDADVSLHMVIVENILAEFWKIDELSHENVKSGIQYYVHLLHRIAKEKGITTRQDTLLIEQFKLLVLSDNTVLHPIHYYADKLKTTEDKLNDACKKSLGISAKQYILNLKITEAKRLLIYSEQNITEIAFRLGFEDSSYFARIFKKKAGLSPRSFLKKYRRFL